MSLRNRLIVTALFTTSLAAAAQARHYEAALADDLNRSYSFTTNKATGSLYSVRISGLYERPTFEEAEPIFTLKPLALPKENTNFFDILTDRHGTREVHSGDQFYLTTVDVNQHFLIFHLISADLHTVVTDGNSDRSSFQLAIKFPLQPGAIAALTAADVHKLVDPVLSLAPSAPVAIQLGQTKEQVKQILGQPDQEIALTSKHIMVFKAVKVVLVDGKVTDIQ